MCMGSASTSKGIITFPISSFTNLTCQNKPVPHVAIKAYKIRKPSFPDVTQTFLFDCHEFRISVC